MREILNLIVDGADFADNVRPNILDVGTGIPEFDRMYYKARVAFEFNGHSTTVPPSGFRTSTACVPTMTSRSSVAWRTTYVSTCGQQAGACFPRD